jgi:hypothetical protein
LCTQPLFFCEKQSAGSTFLEPAIVPPLAMWCNGGHAAAGPASIFPEPP